MGILILLIIAMCCTSDASGENTNLSVHGNKDCLTLDERGIEVCAPDCLYFSSPGYAKGCSLLWSGALAHMCCPYGHKVFNGKEAMFVASRNKNGNGNRNGNGNGNGNGNINGNGNGNGTRNENGNGNGGGKSNIPINSNASQGNGNPNGNNNTQVVNGKTDPKFDLESNNIKQNKSCVSFRGALLRKLCSPGCVSVRTPGPAEGCTVQYIGAYRYYCCPAAGTNGNNITLNNWAKLLSFMATS